MPGWRARYRLAPATHSRGRCRIGARPENHALHAAAVDVADYVDARHAVGANRLQRLRDALIIRVACRSGDGVTRTVYHLIRFRVLTPEDQVRTGLPWVSKLVSADPHHAASSRRCEAIRALFGG